MSPVILKIFRFEDGMEAPVYREYQVPPEEAYTVLQALFYIKEHYDDVPAFRRYQCNRGQCCSCLMTINGRVRRACVTPIADGMVIEPALGYPIIRDLVVDYGRTVNGSYQAKGILLKSREKENTALPRVFLEIDPSLCEGCGDCVDVCPQNQKDNVQSKLGEIITGRVTLVMDGEVAVARRVCHHCNPAPCVNSCPLDAITRDLETGIVSINEDKCIACTVCVTLCPYDNVALYMERGKAVKCDLCGGQPRCVEVCPSDAIKVKKVV